MSQILLATLEKRFLIYIYDECYRVLITVFIHDVAVCLTIISF
jgi:hypothetical protein